MINAVLDDPILVHLRQALDAVYGTRLERVALHGSRARGASRPDSDYDVAVFLRDSPDRVRKLNRLADIVTDVLYDVGGVVHAMPYHAGAYNERRRWCTRYTRMTSLCDAGNQRLPRGSQRVSRPRLAPPPNARP